MFTNLIFLILLPVLFLLLTILSYIVVKRKKTLRKLKSIVPYLFIVFLLTSFRALLLSPLLSHLFKSPKTLLFLNTFILFFGMIVSVKLVAYFLFDFYSVIN